MTREYAHPLPWQIPELVEVHAVECDVDHWDLTDRGCIVKHLCDWGRRHRFRMKNYRTVR